MDTPLGRQYSYPDPKNAGQVLWTATPKYQVGANTNPFINGGKGTGITTSQTTDPTTGNIQVTMTFSQLDTTPGGGSGANWADIIAASNGMLVPTMDSQQVVNGVSLATGALMATDPVSHTLTKNGLQDPNTDYFSPSLSALHNAPDNRDLLATANANPAYKASIQADAYNAASKLPADQQKGAYDEMMATISRELDPNSQDHIIPPNGAAWHQAYTTPEMIAAMQTASNDPTLGRGIEGTTAAPVRLGPAAPPTNVYGGLMYGQPLPSDQAKGGQFDALAASYRPGTSIQLAGKAWDDLSAGGVPAIKIGAPVTMPGMPVNHPLIGNAKAAQPATATPVVVRP